jgi:hypothetical protein
MPKRKHQELEEDTLETGNVDQGDFSDGDDSGEDDEKTEKYEMMREDDIEGNRNKISVSKKLSTIHFYCPNRPRGPYPRI